MIFAILLCLMLPSVNSVNVIVTFDMVKSTLEYYNSHSVLLIFNETYSSSALPKIVKHRQGVIEVVLIWNPNEEFPRILEEFSHEIDLITHKWFVATSSMTSAAFNNVTIPLNSEFTIAKGNPRIGYSLEEIYDVIPGMRLSNPLGRWSANSQEFQLQTSMYMFTRRKDFQGAIINVASGTVDNCDLFSLLLRTSTPPDCFFQKTWFIIEGMLNASTEIHAVPDLNEDTILDGDFDLTIRTAHINAYYMNTRDYAWPLFSAKVLVATSYITQEVRWETFILPFKVQMWVITIIWIILWDLVLSYIQSVNIEKRNKKSFFDYYKDFSFTTLFTFCSQGVFCPSKLSSTRITLLTMFIVPAVLFRGYSAVLTSFLTVQVDKKPFRNIEELSQNSEYKLGWQNIYSFEQAMSLKIRALLKNHILPRDKLPVTNIEGLEKICTEKFSFATIMYAILVIEPQCRYFTLDQRLMMFSVSIELKKGSWYKYYLDRCQRILEFSGIKHRVVSDVLLTFRKIYNKKKRFDETDVRPIKVENVILPFMVLLLGVIASVILLLLEIIFFRLKSREVHKFTSSTTTTGGTNHYDFVL